MRTLAWGTVFAGALALVLALIVVTTGAAAASESTTASPAAETPHTQIDGAVLDRDGRGVDGATVIARLVTTALTTSDASSYQTLTDARGHFRLDGLPPGTYWFIALHPAHPAGSSPALPVVGHLEVEIHLDDEPASA